MSSPIAEAGALRSGGTAAQDIERRRRLLQQWRRHSALVRLLRRLLPAACAAILLGLGVSAGVNTAIRRGDLDKARGEVAVRLLNPNFQGRNTDGRPFLISAASATRDNADASRVTLDQPVFTLGAEGGRTVVRARRGVYREDTRVLELSGGVTLDDAKGNHLATERAVVDTANSNVEGQVPIDGHGPLGRIAASAYAVEGGGARVHFRGRVRSRIENGAALTPAPAAR